MTRTRPRDSVQTAITPPAGPRAERSRDGHVLGGHSGIGAASFMSTVFNE